MVKTIGLHQQASTTSDRARDPLSATDMGFN